jgi:hypothetical protein
MKKRTELVPGIPYPPKTREDWRATWGAESGVRMIEVTVEHECGAKRRMMPGYSVPYMVWTCECGENLSIQVTQPIIGWPAGYELHPAS